MIRGTLIALMMGLVLLSASPVLAETITISVEIKHRKVEGQHTFRVKQGDQVHMRWSADEEVEIHLHGYNIEKTIKPGKPAEWNFTARATGRFPVTSHGYAADKGKAEHGGHSHMVPHRESALIYIEVYPR